MPEIEASGLGLSPPVRGSPVNGLSDTGILRSIPARAGEPIPGDWICSLTVVYPRPCGGAAAVDSTHTLNEGLSPPVRGSPGLQHHLGALVGSIPARAGEPARP